MSLGRRKSEPPGGNEMGYMEVLRDGDLSYKARGAFLFLADKFDGPFSMRQVYGRIKGSHLVIGYILGQLCDKGYVTRMEKGKYLVPDGYRLRVRRI